MDDLIHAALEQITLEGTGGCKLSHLWNLLQSTCSITLDSSLQSYLLHHLQSIPHLKIEICTENINESIIYADEVLRCRFILKEPRPIMSGNKHYIAVIDKIAKSRKIGVSQVALAKSLNIDPKTLFSLMKRMFSMKLLQKFPITVCKSSTNLIALSRFHLSLEDLESNLECLSSTQSTSTIQYTRETQIEDLILQRLASSPSNTLAFTDLYFQLGIEKERTKWLRRILTTMHSQMKIEKFIAENENGKQLYCIRLPPKKAEEIKDNSPALKLQLVRFSNLSLIDTLYLLISMAGSQGAVVSDLSALLRISMKKTSHLCVKFSDHRPDLLTKVIETEGRERRFRFIAAGANSLPTNQLPTISLLDRYSANEAPTDAILHFSPASAAGSLETLVPSATINITRVERCQKLLQLLNEKRIIQVDVDLLDLLSSDSKLDRKTFKRDLELLSQQGKARLIQVSVPTASGLMKQRFLAALSEVDPNGKELEEFVKLLKKEGAKPSLSKNKLKIEAAVVDVLHKTERPAKPATSLLQQLIDTLEPPRTLMLDYGFIGPKFLRIKKFNLFLYRISTKISLKDTPFHETFLNQISVESFLQLIGFYEASEPYEVLEYIESSSFDPSKMLLSLPESLLKSLLGTRMQQRLKERLLQYLDILQQLRILQFENDNGNLLAVELEQQVPLVDPLSREFYMMMPMRNSEEIKVFWKELELLSVQNPTKRKQPRKPAGLDPSLMDVQTTLVKDPAIFVDPQDSLYESLRTMRNWNSSEYLPRIARKEFISQLNSLQNSNLLNFQQAGKALKHIKQKYSVADDVIWYMAHKMEKILQGKKKSKNNCKIARPASKSLKRILTMRKIPTKKKIIRPSNLDKKPGSSFLIQEYLSSRFEPVGRFRRQTPTRLRRNSVRKHKWTAEEDRILQLCYAVCREREARLGYTCKKRYSQISKVFDPEISNILCRRRMLTLLKDKHCLNEINEFSKDWELTRGYMDKHEIEYDRVNISDPNTFDLNLILEKFAEFYPKAGKKETSEKKMPNSLEAAGSTARKIKAEFSIQTKKYKREIFPMELSNEDYSVCCTLCSDSLCQKCSNSFFVNIASSLIKSLLLLPESEFSALKGFVLLRSMPEAALKEAAALLKKHSAVKILKSQGLRKIPGTKFSLSKKFRKTLTNSCEISCYLKKKFGKERLEDASKCSNSQLFSMLIDMQSGYSSPAESKEKPDAEFNENFMDGFCYSSGQKTFCTDQLILKRILEMLGSRGCFHVEELSDLGSFDYLVRVLNDLEIEKRLSFVGNRRFACYQSAAYYSNAEGSMLPIRLWNYYTISFDYQLFSSARNLVLLKIIEMPGINRMELINQLQMVLNAVEIDCLLYSMIVNKEIKEEFIKYEAFDSLVLIAAIDKMNRGDYIYFVI